MQKPSKHEIWAGRALLAGAIGGLVLALLASPNLGANFAPSLDERGNVDTQKGAIAHVNGRLIDRSEFAVAYQALLSDKSKAPTAGDKKLVLARLVEEELLVQRGLEIGLTQSDASIRKAIAAAVIEFVLAQNKQGTPSEAQLRAFYETHKARFTPADRLQVARIFVRHTPQDEPALATRLDAIRAALRAGEKFSQVAARLGDAILPPLPRAMLPRNKMYDYLGPTLTGTAIRLEAGAISDAIHDGSGWHFLHVVRVAEGTPPPFANLRRQLETALRRTQDDKALRDYLDWLAKRADIVLAPDAPQ